MGWSPGPKLVLRLASQPVGVLVPAQESLGLLVVLPHPVPPMHGLDQPGRLRPRPEVAPVGPALLRLAPRLTPSDQPAEVPSAVGGDPPAPQGREPAAQLIPCRPRTSGSRATPTAAGA